MAERNGVGLFARMLTERFPVLPVEEEGRLNDMPLRENFIERVFAYYRWTEMLTTDPTPGGLVRFHTAHKMTLMAHSPKHYQEMGRLVAQAGAMPWAEMVAAYGAAADGGIDGGRQPGQARQRPPAPDGLSEEPDHGRGQAGAAGA